MKYEAGLEGKNSFIDSFSHIICSGAAVFTLASTQCDIDPVCVLEMPRLLPDDACATSSVWPSIKRPLWYILVVIVITLIVTSQYHYYHHPIITITPSRYHLL